MNEIMSLLNVVTLMIEICTFSFVYIIKLTLLSGVIQQDMPLLTSFLKEKLMTTMK